MSVLDILSDQINAQFGENTNRTLSENIKNSKNIDFSSERKYVEEGFLRTNPFFIDSKSFKLLLQQPTATVLVKKKMFSSIAENYRTDYMDADEKLYLKASKVLFQNKCNQISAIEKLSKITEINKVNGKISDQLLPIILSLLNSINSGDGQQTLFNQENNSRLSKVSNIVATLNKLNVYTKTSDTTSWITSNTSPFANQLGDGTGVIEITNFKNLSTTNTNSLDGGSFNLNIADPYNLMNVTEYDIEKAIADATNLYLNNKTLANSLSVLDSRITDLNTKLNSLRKSRGASEITFKVSKNTLLNKKVIAIVDRQGVEIIFNYKTSSGLLNPSNAIDVSNDYLRGGEILGEDGLDFKKTKLPNSEVSKVITQSELLLFKDLLSTIYNKINLQENSKSEIQTTNKKTNYARRKLRFSFLGKSILQPMDEISIFINSRSNQDQLINNQINSFFDLSRNTNNTLVNIFDKYDTLFHPEGNLLFQIEKKLYVGEEFSDSLWSLVRNYFINDQEGACVFSGVIQKVQPSYSDGNYSVSVSGTTKSVYLEMGKINFKPAVDVYNGLSFDPLTPFKTKFDQISVNNANPELLDENKALLSGNSTLVKFKLGPETGKKVTQDNYIQDAIIDKANKKISKVFYAPDGLVYKWKEGISIYTQKGTADEFSNPNVVGNPTIYNEPFAGQDIMNIISLSITGQPYNFATYWKSVTSSQQVGNDSSNKSSSYSFDESLRLDLEKRNTLWGNFIPFKNLIMSEEAYKNVITAQSSIFRKTSQLDENIKKLQEIQNYTNIFGATNVVDGFDSSRFSEKYNQASSEAKNLIEVTKNIVAEIQKEDTKYLNQIGNDVSFDFNDFMSNGDFGNQTDKNYRFQLRKQINRLTRRMAYDVRANEDKNLFIVDDTYDKDYDLLGYAKSLGDIKLFNNQYASVKEKVMTVANLLNLEVFCDSQGHIRVRQPEYNKIPSSIFFRMMQMKEKMGIQIFPDFLNDLFSSQLNSYKQGIEKIEDEIRLDCAALGFQSDDTALSFIHGESDLNSGSNFYWLTNSDGFLSEIEDLMIAANPDLSENASDTTSETFTFLENQVTQTKNPFNPKERTNTFAAKQRYGAILDALTKEKLNNSGYGIYDVYDFYQNKRIDEIIDRLKLRSGVTVHKNDFILNQGLDTGVGQFLSASPRVDAVKIINELSDKIAKRQKLIQLFYKSLKSVTEYRSLDDGNNDTTATNLLFESESSTRKIPEVLEHLIEDESFDDYGKNSGKRFIIKAHQITSMSISENQPDFTMVEVTGYQNIYAPDATVNSYDNFFPSGGNALTTAVAIDNDMWRQYGIIQQSSITMPFFSDPDSQCAPYAAMILSRARRNILRGNITIIGNEFMQVGDVVYIEDCGLLFYVSEVNHSFSNGSDFKTTLSLTYGHTPGEYIPTPLDMIGKLIYNNKDAAEVVIQRQSNTWNEKSFGAIIKDNNSSIVVSDPKNNSGATNLYDKQNAVLINNVLFNVAYTINSNLNKNPQKSILQLRVYGDQEPNEELMTFASSIKDLLTVDSFEIPQFNSGSSKNSQPKKLSPDDVEIKFVDLSNDDDSSSPSQQALDFCRNIASKGTTTSSSNNFKDQIRKALYNQIVDVYVKFESVS